MLYNNGTTWENKSGEIVAEDIGVGADGAVWVTGRATLTDGYYPVYRRVGNDWERLDENLAGSLPAVHYRGISVGNAKVWLANKAGAVYSRSSAR